MARKIYKYDNPSEEFIKVKHNGKIFTPDYLVKNILDLGHYVAGNISGKHVIDNSCGDGQFLIWIVERYCEDYLSHSNDLAGLKVELEKFIHAVEIEEKELNVCKDRCSKVAEIYGVHDVQWDFLCENAFKVDKFNNKMDFVIGNPPYVRVHNLADDFDAVKDYKFAQQGMTDLFYVFFEIGLNMLNEKGILCYITPSSYFTSNAGSGLRSHLIDNNFLESVCDLKHYQAFDCTTYTAITCINKTKDDDITSYYEYDEETLSPRFVSDLDQQDFLINGFFYFSTRERLKRLRSILTNEKKVDIQVKNGYATLADKVFIGNFDFDSKYVIPVLKASTGKWSKIFFPYDSNSKLVPLTVIQEDERMFSYLKDNEDKLNNRDSEDKSKESWHAFGRTQAIQDTFKDKLSINTLVRKVEDIKIIDVPANQGVYSGLYIVSDSIDYKTIKKVLMTNEFVEYVSQLGKYKSGGYYTYSSKDISRYLAYMLGES